MSGYQINPPIHVGECACCGKVQEREICEDCEAKEEARKAPYLAFWAALTVDAELQRSFDHETQAFDSGHYVTCNKGLIYCICQHEGTAVKSGPLSRVAEWCIENREELI